MRLSLLIAAPCVIGLALILGAMPAPAADAAAGKTAAAACAECHEPRDWIGESQSSLESLIRDVVQGNVRHSRKIVLNDAEIANIAAYWAAGK